MTMRRNLLTALAVPLSLGLVRAADSLWHYLQTSRQGAILYARPAGGCLLRHVVDARASYSDAAWTALATGVAQATLTGLRGAAASAASPSPVFAMSSDGANKLATWSGVAKVDLIGNGALIGLIVDNSMQPVQGAQISISDASVQLAYAKNDFSGPATPSATATLPYFVATPNSAKVVKSTGWTISAPSPATATWSVPLVGSAPNYLVMIPFLGK